MTDAAAGAAAPRIGLVWAQARGGAIGQGGVMPWHLPEDLAHFKEVTLGGPVLMGRRTWESIPERFRPLPGRRNIVLTRSADWSAEGAEVVGSIDAALALCGDGPVWVIGGGELYASVIERADVLEVTEIDADVEADTHAPAIDDGWQLAAVDPASGWHVSRTGLPYRFLRYTRP